MSAEGVGSKVMRANNFGPPLLTNSELQGRFPLSGLALGDIWDQFQVLKGDFGKGLAAAWGGRVPRELLLGGGGAQKACCCYVSSGTTASTTL